MNLCRVPRPPLMRAIWKGAISFGLVSIPISLFPAIRREELKFRLLRDGDLSPINYKRVAEADGKEVPWDKIVKGYEYEKGKFVVLKEDDFKRVDIEATQTVDIINFVKLEDVDPLLFYKPYYMEVTKGGGKAYVLLREALKSTEKIAIAKVVIKTRQHLAAVKPQGEGLMLELMHFPQELVDAEEFKTPAETNVSKPEMNMALKLIESMTSDWKPEEYHDEYKEALEEMIEDKLAHGDAAPAPTAKKAKPTNVIDLVAVLQESLEQAGAKTKSGGGSHKAAAKKAKPAAKKARAKTRKKAA
jgi:DNA end-binding protein Ku